MAKTAPMEVLVRVSDGEVFPLSDYVREQAKREDARAVNNGKSPNFFQSKGFRVETRDVEIGEQPKPQPAPSGLGGDAADLLAQLIQQNKELSARLEALEGNATIPPPDDPSTSSVQAPGSFDEELGRITSKKALAELAKSYGVELADGSLDEQKAELKKMLA